MEGEALSEPFVSGGFRLTGRFALRFFNGITCGGHDGNIHQPGLCARFP